MNVSQINYNLLYTSVGEYPGIVPALLKNPREKAIEDVINGYVKQLCTSCARFSNSGFNSYLLYIRITQLTCNFSLLSFVSNNPTSEGDICLLINCSTKNLIMHLFCHLSSSCLRSLIVFFGRKTGPLNFLGVILHSVDELPQFIRYHGFF